MSIWLWGTFIYIVGGIISGSILPIYALKLHTRYKAGLIPTSRGEKVPSDIDAPFGITWARIRIEKCSIRCSGDCTISGGWHNFWSEGVCWPIYHSCRGGRWLVRTLSQPAWYFTYITHDQYILIVLSMVYTFCWIRGMKNHWRRNERS